MVVCAYFQQGRCRYGDRCRNEHPGQPTSGSSTNRFSALGANQPGSTQQQDKSNNYYVTAESIQLDLTAGKERPTWVFSAYGPGKNAPRQLFGGPSREQSFEEMRWRHYEAAAAGKMNQAVQEAQKLHEETSQQIQIILNDLNGAVKYVIDGQNEHPNRIDIVEGKKSIAPSFGQQQGPAAPSASSAPAFGQPSSLSGSTLSASTPAFGQPSLPGQSQPAFGKPSGLVSSTTGPAFGKSSMLGSAQPAFGRPSFGQPSFGQTGFGQPSATGGSGFANVGAGPSPFAQATQPNPLAPGNTLAFGQSSAPSPFGQTPTQTTSPFSQIGIQPASSTGFGQPSLASSPFGQPAPTPSSFGQVQSQQTSSSNPFSQAQSISSTPNVFGQPTATSAPISTTVQPIKTSSAPRASLGPKPIIKVNLGELNPIPDLKGDTIRDPGTQKLTRWKGQPVQYKGDSPRYLHPGDNKTWVRIFFPDGPPEVSTLRDATAKDENYTTEITQQYENFVRTGAFKDDIIPKVPPKTEWVSFDF